MLSKEGRFCMKAAKTDTALLQWLELLHSLSGSGKENTKIRGLCSRTPSHPQLPGYRDVPDVVPATEDIPADLSSQAHLSGAPPGSLGTHLCQTSIPPC